MAAYEHALARLAQRSYECFCTRREIAEAASAPHTSVARYPGTCRDLTDAERATRRTVRPPALRLRAKGASTTVHDLLHGDITGPVDDFVIRRNDRVPAYNLAVVVDDGDTGVDQVVRADDLLPSAINQAFLAGVLGYRVPTYAHVPLAVNAQGVRLAKRDGAVTLADLGRLGLNPAEVMTIIAQSLKMAQPGESADLDRLLQRFDPALIPREPWIVRAGPLDSLS
jgi:glutamyl-tRNA synthetase